MHPAAPLALIVDGRALRALRLAAALTQAELARTAGISRITIGRLEKGSPASPYSVRRIAQALGVAACTFSTVEEQIA